MTVRLGGEEAWALVREVTRASAERNVFGDRIVVRVPEHRALAVRIDADGGWSVAGRVELTPDATRTLDLFLPVAIGGPTLTVAQIGQSLDGRVATRSGHSHYVTGEADRDRLHGLRALVDAVIVGVGTVVADDPRLTVRRVEGADPVRVVLDPRGRADPDSTVFTDGCARTLWVRHEPVTDVAAHVEVVTLPPGDGSGIEPAAILALLHRRGLRRVLVEGGGNTVSRFLAAGRLDRLHVTVAPLILGSGRHGLTLPAIDHLEDALRPRSRHFLLGQDILFDLDLRG